MLGDLWRQHKRTAYPDHPYLAEQLRKAERDMDIYAPRKETIERIFANAKDKHGMLFTHRRVWHEFLLG